MDLVASARNSRWNWSRIAIAAVSLIGLVAAGYAGAWFFAAHQLRSGVALWAAARSSAGDEAAWQDDRLSGFPGAIRLTLDSPHVRSRGLGGEDIRWSAGGLSVVMNPLRPRTLEFRPEGRQHVEVAPGRTVPQAFDVEAPIIVVAVTGKPGGGGDADFGAESLRVTTAAGEEFATVARATGRLSDLHPADADHQTPSYSLTLDASDVSLPPTLGLPLGRVVSHLSLAAELTGSFPPGPLVRSATQWRDSGGTVEVRDLSAGYGPLNLIANGTLALDKAMQPMGAMSAEVGGFAETVDRLRDLGYVRPRDAATAKLVLGALAQRSGKSGNSAIAVPLTLQDRVLSAGPLRLFEMPPVVWPADAGPGPAASVGSRVVAERFAAEGRGR